MPDSGLRLGHNRKRIFITTDLPRVRSSRAHTFLMNRIFHFLPIVSKKFPV